MLPAPRHPAHHPARRAASGLALAAVLLLAAPSAAAADRDVVIEGFDFQPGSVTVRVGDTVTWENRDGVEHTATSIDGRFDTGLLATGERGSIRFTRAGTYRYLCTPHPTMVGVVVVTAAGSGSPRPPDSSTASTLVDERTDTPGGDARWTALAIAALVALALADRRLGRPQRSGHPAVD